MTRCAQGTGRVGKAQSSARFNAGGLRLPAGIVAVALVLFFVTSTPQRAQAQTFTPLYSFLGGAGDGSNPQGGLVIDSAGNLYGTTQLGGAQNYGTVFKIDTSNHETVLYSFKGGSDGVYPTSSLVMDSKGNLYGTTLGGGVPGGYGFGMGTAFKIDASGNETVVYAFQGGNDGMLPQAGLITDAAGNLYGTTVVGGPSGNGTVFKIDTSNQNTESVLYSFPSSDMNWTGGAFPYGGLVTDSAGNLYGTTSVGGTQGLGTVFKIDASGTESVLYSFKGGNDGRVPQASLIVDSSGSLYGTTYDGGSSLNNGSGFGTVFKIDTSGAESVLYSFKGGTDGAYLYSGLVMDSAGNLYGTTYEGGSSLNNGYGFGTVFKIDTSHNESVLYSFTGSDDGANPVAGLILDPSGNLYGTASNGDPSNHGTVFKIAMSVPFSQFSAKLDITAGPPPGFQLKALFTQGSGGAAIDPVAQGLTLSVGTYTVTIPPGSFQMTKKGTFVYVGTINGVELQSRILQLSANTYQMQIDASGVDLTSQTNPVPVTLSFGNNTGTVQVNAGQ